MNNFWDFWGRIGVTVVTTIVSFTLWKVLERVYIWWYNRQLRLQAMRHAAASGVKQVVLALSVGETIDESVRNFLRERGWLGGESDIPIITVNQREGFGSEEGQWYAYLERVKEAIRTIRSEGFTRVHVFTKLPVPLAVMVGATLTNGPAAYLYHYNAGRYLPVGQITFETVKL